MLSNDEKMREEYETEEVFEHVLEEILRRIEDDINETCLEVWESQLKKDDAWDAFDDLPPSYDQYVVRGLHPVTFDQLKDKLNKRLSEPIQEQRINDDDNIVKETNEVAEHVVSVMETALYSVRSSAVRTTPLWNVSFVSRLLTDCARYELIGLNKCEDLLSEHYYQLWKKEQLQQED
jgi:hypothetical protein